MEAAAAQHSAVLFSLSPGPHSHSLAFSLSTFYVAGALCWEELVGLFASTLFSTLFSLVPLPLSFFPLYPHSLSRLSPSLPQSNVLSLSLSAFFLVPLLLALFIDLRANSPSFPFIFCLSIGQPRLFQIWSVHFGNCPVCRSN